MTLDPKSCLTVLAIFVAAGSRSAVADLIVNGNFSAGNDSSYTTGYHEQSYAHGGEGPVGGNYGIMTNSQVWHNSFVSFGDHTTGTGNMMIFNGAPAANTTLWQQSGIAVVPGAVYRLEFWARSAYPDNPALIQITASVNSLDTTFQLGGTGAWQHFSMDFTADSNPETIRLVDNVLVPGGNDFAIDDISLNLVTIPLPPAAWAGLGSLAGVAGIGMMRRRTRSVN